MPVRSRIQLLVLHSRFGDGGSYRSIFLHTLEYIESGR